MAKYGMSMCALGMAEEFKDVGIAVNTLWPRTGSLNCLHGAQYSDVSTGHVDVKIHAM